MPHPLTLILCLSALTVAAAGPDTAAGMLKIAKPRVVAADFVQTRRLADLDMEVRITGSMVSELDGRLRWQVDSPVRSVTVIDREKLTHYDGETKQLAVIRQDGFPWLKVLRDSLDDWLSGDRERLAARFDLTVPKPRVLHLEPREATQRKLYRSVEIELAEDSRSIAAIRIEEGAGDRLEIRFAHIRHDPQLPPDIWRMPPR